MRGLRKNLKGQVWAIDDGKRTIATLTLWRTESEPSVHCASALVRHLIIFAPLFTGLYRNYFPEASVRLRLSRNPDSVARLRTFSFVFGPLSIIISSPDSGSGREVRATSILFEPIRISTKSRFVATRTVLRPVHIKGIGLTCAVPRSIPSPRPPSPALFLPRSLWCRDETRV